jgi:hypothetical protein
MAREKDRDGKIMFENYEVAHFRLLTDANYLPYGRSYIEPARKTYKQYVLMKDAMLLHRITRAPEKRVFTINVGNIPPHEVDGYMQKVMQKMKKTPYIDQQTGEYNLKYNVQNMMEDFYLPTRGNDTTTKIDTVNKTGNSWIQNRYIGIYKLTQSGSYAPIQRQVSGSRVSTTLQKINLFYSSPASASAKLPYSSSYSFADVNRETSADWRNARYIGCKLSATAVNVNSTQTVDGGPVVKVTKVNPNKIVFANGQLTTINEATTGIKKKSI